MFKSMVVTLLCIASSTLAARAQTLPQMRMTPAEIKTGPTDNNQIGSSELAGVHTKVLFGDPAKAGFYSILLFVPAHVTIEAHTHRDNRVATVVSGEWHFGYGEHFAQTAETAVVVQISGYGPTDTKYFDPANDPANKK